MITAYSNEQNLVYYRVTSLVSPSKRITSKWSSWLAKNVKPRKTKSCFESATALDGKSIHAPPIRSQAQETETNRRSTDSLADEFTSNFHQTGPQKLFKRTLIVAQT